MRFNALLLKVIMGTLLAFSALAQAPATQARESNGFCKGKERWRHDAAHCRRNCECTLERVGLGQHEHKGLSQRRGKLRHNKAGEIHDGRRSRESGLPGGERDWVGEEDPYSNWCAEMRD
jgi:hypothetical protein